MNYLRNAAILVVLIAAAAHGSKPLNVVFILADDLGWSDTTLFGTTSFYETPHIERLAARGMTFTRAYSSSPLCSPTRASILTGQAPARHGITAPNCHIGKVVLSPTPSPTAPPNQHATSIQSVNRLRTDHPTLVKSLRDSGYRTGHFGKWHLGLEPYSPLEHGFDVDIPHWHGPGPAGSYVAPWRYPDFDPQTPKEHIEDRMAEEAVAFIAEGSDRPFLLNYWMFSVHAPFDAKTGLVSKYRARVDTRSPQRCPVYAAMIESMDDAVGTLLDALDEQGIADETVVVLASDNGGNMYNVVEGEAPTSNAPLRGGKATMYEGGVRGPCVVVWPGVTRPGARSDVPIHSCDFYPTLLDMLGIEKPEGQPFDGTSLTGLLAEDPSAAEELADRPFFTYFPHSPRVPDWLPPAISVHRGDWKLIRLFHAGQNGGHRWKLFNLRDDLGETNDLSAERPDLVRELDELIENHLVDTDAVRPAPNPRFDPASFDPKMEGVPRRKAPAKVNALVAGWRAMKHCSLSLEPTALVVNSSGRDPHLSLVLTKPLPAGTYSVALEMQTRGPVDAKLFWKGRGKKRPFQTARSVDLRREGTTGPLNAEIEASAGITELRLDPMASPGKARIKRLVFTSDSGERRQVWVAEKAAY